MPQSSDFKSHLRLHFVVFIWGFTAIIGDLITKQAMPLVWNRILIAFIVLFIYTRFKKISLKIDRKSLLQLGIAGTIIAAHWVTFFHAIKISNVSVTLVCLASTSFFVALLEPIFFKRKIFIHEIILGFVVISSIAMIFTLRTDYFWGIITALISAFLSSLFSVLNGKFTHKHGPEFITIYELGTGLVALTVVMIATGNLNVSILPNNWSDTLYLLLLGVVCTAYPFIESVRVMRVLTPFTVVLAINMEPIYGIILAYFMLGESERMSPSFYGGAILIIGTLFANAWIRKKMRGRALLVSNKN